MSLRSGSCARVRSHAQQSRKLSSTGLTSSPAANALDASKRVTATSGGGTHHGSASHSSDPLGLGEQVRLRLAAIEQRDPVTGGERLLDEGATDELRPAQHQDPHGVEPYRRAQTR
jgi:hypothetical protein